MREARSAIGSRLEQVVAMLRRNLTRTLTYVAGAVVLLAAAAQATPTIAIVSPVEGATLSRTLETITVSGTATFDAPVPVTRKYHFRRDACGNAANANRRLSVTAGGETIGCGGLTSAATPLVDVYPAADGVPVTVDPIDTPPFVYVCIDRGNRCAG